MAGKSVTGGSRNLLLIFPTQWGCRRAVHLLSGCGDTWVGQKALKYQTNPPVTNSAPAEDTECPD